MTRTESTNGPDLVLSIGDTMPDYGEHFAQVYADLGAITLMQHLTGAPDAHYRGVQILHNACLYLMDRRRYEDWMLRRVAGYLEPMRLEAVA